MAKVILSFVLLLTLLPSIGLAEPTTLVFNDPFHTDPCGSYPRPAGCDVIAGAWADQRQFDIQRVEVLGTNQVKLYFDYGQTPYTTPYSLAPFSDRGLELNVGDLFVGGYAIPLYNHDFWGQTHTGWVEAQAGSIYTGITRATAYETLNLVNPGMSGWIYDYYAPVWMKTGTVVQDATVGITVASGGSKPLDRGKKTDPPYYMVTLQFTGFNVYDAVQTGGLFWASTTCANDVVPEPSAYVVLVGGLSGVVFMVRRRRRDA